MPIMPVAMPAGLVSGELPRRKNLNFQDSFDILLENEALQRS